MIAQQLRARDIHDERVIAAFEKIPRHAFVSKEYQQTAYADFPLPIGHGQTISQPYIVALMTQALSILPHETILEIGTGSGYQTAILATLAKAVYTIERLETLSQQAQSTLSQLLFDNITYAIGDGTLGWKKHAPYDKIIITAACPQLPLSLKEQLNESGRIIAPVGTGFSQTLTLFNKQEGILKKTILCDCAFVPLIGEQGFNES